MNEERLKAVIRGAVQGVGFRPFVYRLAGEMDLRGWVSNSVNGVFLELEGNHDNLKRFISRLQKEKPPRAIFQSLEFSLLEPKGYTNFEIRQSELGGEKSAFILPDIAPCIDCLKEITDPNNRRYRYPFTNCTNCGPRFSIIESLPYDRQNTSMKRFVMCSECQQEYNDPTNRRFHAEPIACPRCGPKLALWGLVGPPISDGDTALLQAADSLRDGKIIAFKGVGGFQLMVDARNEVAVHRLRELKRREQKPFAVMFPSLECLQTVCCVDDSEGRLLNSPEAPIVLLKKRAGKICLSALVAPENPNLGAMLPSSPLHHILMDELGFPIVATSGNLSDEPICIEETEAVERLKGIADLFLVHDRPIVRPVDDSIARIVLDREMILRRARGYAPLPIHISEEMPAALAVGAQLKNTIAIAKGNEIFISQHIGNLETAEAMWAFQKGIADLERLYDFKPEIAACDLHPEYLSTRHAKTLGLRLVPVQHHFAHVLSCMAENELDGPALGVVWDGTGLGPDGTIWGGEFLFVDNSNAIEKEPPFTRYAHFRNFPLPGGDSAIKQPCRVALGWLWEFFGDESFRQKDLLPLQEFSHIELEAIRRALNQGINTPFTSSAGRLFDAVAALIGLCQRTTFEGQAAMALEFAINHDIKESYQLKLAGCEPIVIDWSPLLLELVKDLRLETPTGTIAAKFHNTMVEVIIEIALRSGRTKIVLSGGCFQNKYLLEHAILRLRRAGFKPFWHQRVPTNDGGIALGQIIAAAQRSPKGDRRAKASITEHSTVLA